MKTREQDIKAAQKIYVKCRQIKEDLIYLEKIESEYHFNIAKHIQEMNRLNHNIHDIAREMERALDPDQISKDELKTHTLEQLG